MAQLTPPADGPQPPSLPCDLGRGFMSCFTWAEHPEGPISAETMSLLTELFSDLYKEAFRRLPIEDMPDLHFDPHMSGMCVGLLDPVTNIIVNTLSDDDLGGSSAFPFGRSRSTLREISRGGREQWYSMAYMSIRILIEFMRTYFRLLSEEQAGRYLLWARGDLALAVLFVEHELYLERPAIPDPRSPRTRFSFQLAVAAASHPAPDYLAWLSTLWLPQHQLETLAPILIPTNRKLTVDDVWTISSVLRSHGRPTPFSPPQGPAHHRKDCVDLGDGRIGYTTVVQLPGDYITSLRHHPDIRSMLSNYREDAMEALPRTRRTQLAAATRKPCELDSPNGTICLYIRSLKMFLQGTIHGFYLKALAKLSSRHACRFMRAILLAGHCYGPMDPVSNILVTAIWYHRKFPPPPPPSGSPSLEHDMLDTLSILRTECRSLVGLVALFCDTVSDQSFHRTLKSLCHMKCDLSTEVQRHLQSMQRDGSSPNPFSAATAAAQHPQSSALAEFLVSLSPMKLQRLRSLTSSNGTLSDDSLRQIFDIIGGPASAMPEVFPLCDNALFILSRKRSDHAGLRRFIREEIVRLLQKYAYHHPMEPKYELVCICGVEVIGHRQSSYHVNFMAAAAGSRSENTLFFAELGHDESFCCPVPQPCTGRCYYGEVSATKIVYPDMIRYFSCDVTCGGTGLPETPLETDYIFADLGRDLKLVKALQRSADEQEAVRRGLYIREEFLHCEDPEWWNDYDVPEWYDEY